MIKIENTEVCGWETAIKYIRNLKDNCGESDSGYCLETLACHSCRWNRKTEVNCKANIDKHSFVVGKNDLQLMKTIAQRGTDLEDFLKMINVTIDITAPLYWWEEFIYYQPYVTLQKFNLMDKIQEREFTINDFSCENLYEDVIANPFTKIIDCLNFFRDLFLQEEDIDDYHLIQQLLPVSYNFKATTNFNYHDLKNIYLSKNISNKKEWTKLKKWIETLPYFKEICLED